MIAPRPQLPPAVPLIGPPSKRRTARWDRRPSGLLLACFFSILATQESTVVASTPRRSIIQLAQLQLPGRTSPRPTALRAWALEMRLRTSVRIAQDPVLVRADSPRLLRYPLLILAGAGPLGVIHTKVVARLREHLRAGGLLLIDDVGRSGPSRSFDRDVRKLIKRVLGRPLRPLSAKDVVYRTFYRLERPFGRRATSRVIEGVKVGSRWAVLYERNDLLGAFQRSAGGGNARSVLPGGERQRELAWRLGVNLILYAVSLDYKDDHTHVGHLLRRRRGQPSQPSQPSQPKRRTP